MGGGGFGVMTGLAGRGGGGEAGSTNAFILGGRDPIEALVALYNNLGQAMPELGQLRVVGDLAKPSIVLFRSTLQPSAMPEFKLKAFALKGIAENEWGNLETVLNQELYNLAANHGSVQVARMTQVTLHRDTGLLIVIAPESALQAAESLVTAWRDDHPPAADNHSPAVLPTIIRPTEGR